MEFHIENIEHAYDCKALYQEEAIQTAFQAMSEVQGWTTIDKARLLMEIIFERKPEVVVEIGVYGGKSFLPMALALKHNKKGIAYGIDPWSNEASAEGWSGVNHDWWLNLDHDAILSGLLKAMDKYQLYNYIKLINTTSQNAPSIQNIDLLHIDGNHSEEIALQDVMKWVPLVKPGGLIVFDDTDWSTTQTAVEWLNTHCRKIGEAHEHNVWMIWIKE